MGTIQLRDVNKSFGATVIIPKLDLDIEDGEFVVFVGPSGCGKSTLLRLIAGLEDTTSGKIMIDGQRRHRRGAGGARARDGLPVLRALPAHDGRQEHRLPAEDGRRGQGRRSTRRSPNAARILNLTNYLERKPGQLSGGQRQRVAIGRAIVRKPAAFLFDEPLSNLDAALRGTMRLEISELHQQLGKTMIYVTHDQVEAMTMADKIVVLNAGNIEQVGSPLELYRTPANLFVAGFIGSPKMNFVEGAEAGEVRRQDHRRPSRAHRGRDHPGEGAWKGEVGVAEHLGADTFIHVNAGPSAPSTSAPPARSRSTTATPSTSPPTRRRSTSSTPPERRSESRRHRPTIQETTSDGPRSHRQGGGDHRRQRRHRPRRRPRLRPRGRAACCIAARDRDRVDAAAAAIAEEFGVAAIGHACDVATAAGCASLIEAVRAPPAAATSWSTTPAPARTRRSSRRPTTSGRPTGTCT